MLAAALILLCEALNAATLKIAQTPAAPRSSEAVTITVRGGGAKHQPLTLQFQVVEPGSYIALGDPAFRTTWESVPLNDEGRDGDEKAADGIFTARIPSQIQVHRRLIRYRIVSGTDVLAPAEGDEPNYAYFVYDGVPAWRAAINPQSRDPSLSTPALFGTNVMRSLPVYHLISKKESVENATWYEQAPFGNEEARRKYSYTGTFVDDQGTVHDHVRFRARGGQWRYSMGKNMWKIDFPRGSHLQARDDYGQPYKTKWEKLNLGACIQQASSRHRGEQGMFEAVGFRLFNLAGVEAPQTHWIHWRVITGAEESPTDQYSGDFWGLYLATEDVDDAFLKEHQLPPGELYKLDFGRPRSRAKNEAEQGSNEVFRFISGMRRATPEWWQANVDLPRYYSYRSIVECIHHYDIYAGKNYFYYLNPVTHHWSVIPWDLDLTWANNMHGTGQEPFYQAGLLFQEPFQHEYRNRLREIRDLLYNPEQADALIDECAAIISDPAGGLSFVDADRAKWDYHPILLSQFVSRSKGRQGEFYKIAPGHDFRGMVQLMKDYVRERGEWIDSQLLAGEGDIPPTPNVSRAGVTAEAVEFRASDSNNSSTYQWRLAEITPIGESVPHTRGKYEITLVWQKVGGAVAQVPLRTLQKGRTYRVRARLQDAAGRCGHWSAPAQFRIQ